LLSEYGEDFVKRMQVGLILFSLAGIVLFNNGCSSKSNPLSAARNIIGTWEMSTPVTVNIATNFCDFVTMQLRVTEKWDIVFVITSGTDENHVNVKMTFAISNSTIVDNCGGLGTGAIPEVSPMFLTGVISSTTLTLYNGSTQFGEFEFISNSMQGTIDYTWTSGWSQRIYTDTNAVILRK
jgi:hypothetical protein